MCNWDKLILCRMCLCTPHDDDDIGDDAGDGGCRLQGVPLSCIALHGYTVSPRKGLCGSPQESFPTSTGPVWSLQWRKHQEQGSGTLASVGLQCVASIGCSRQGAPRSERAPAKVCQTYNSSEKTASAQNERKPSQVHSRHLQMINEKTKK